MKVLNGRRYNMITNDDLFAFCDLSPEEIEVIAEHNHEDLILSIAQNEMLTGNETQDVVTIKHYLEEHIEIARFKGERTHEEALTKVYTAFNMAHPTADMK